MVNVVVEIQASHVGIGKSTFASRLNYPQTDDCVKMIESFPSFFSNCNDQLRAFLVLENAAASLDSVVSKLEPGWTVVSSRSPLLSCVQFGSPDLDCNELETYYRRRLEHAGVDYVHILDFGDAVCNDLGAVMTGFERMWERGRLFERTLYPSFESYRTFFEEAEEKKRGMLETILHSPFYAYSRMPFDYFEDVDFCQTVETIEATRKRKA